MKNEKQVQAKTLFFQTDIPKTEIADMLGIPRRTLHHWIKENNWELQKHSAAHMPSILAENCYYIIARLQQQLLSEERRTTPVTRQEADTLHKLVITIGKLKSRTTLNESMEIMGNFMESLQESSPAVADQIAPYVDNYMAARTVYGTQPHVADTAERSTKENYDDGMDSYYNTANDDVPGKDFRHDPVTINDTAQQTFLARLNTRPDYKELLASFRQQDENLRHMFPLHSAQPRSKAA